MKILDKLRRKKKKALLIIEFDDGSYLKMLVNLKDVDKVLDELRNVETKIWQKFP